MPGHQLLPGGPDRKQERPAGPGSGNRRNRGLCLQWRSVQDGTSQRDSRGCGCARLKQWRRRVRICISPHRRCNAAPRGHARPARDGFCFAGIHSFAIVYRSLRHHRPCHSGEHRNRHDRRARPLHAGCRGRHRKPTARFVPCRRAQDDVPHDSAVCSVRSSRPIRRRHRRHLLSQPKRSGRRLAAGGGSAAGFVRAWFCAAKFETGWKLPHAQSITDGKTKIRRASEKRILRPAQSARSRGDRNAGNSGSNFFAG